MAKRKSKRRRSRKSFSVLSALEAYVYATILTEGVAGTSPMGFITGQGDLGTVTSTTSDSWHGSQTLSTVTVGAGRLLRKPIANINRNIMKPALGAGIKL